MKHDHIQTDTKGKNSMVQKSCNLICLICAGMGIDFLCKAGLYKELLNYSYGTANFTDFSGIHRAHEF